MTQAALHAMEEVLIIVQNVVKNIDIMFRHFKNVPNANLVCTIISRNNNVYNAIKAVILVPIELFKDVQVVIKIASFPTIIVIIKNVQMDALMAIF